MIGKILFLWIINLLVFFHSLKAQKTKLIGYWALDSIQTNNLTKKAEGYFMFADSSYEALEVREASRTGFLNGKWNLNPKDSIIWYQGKTVKDSFSVVLIKLSDTNLVFKNRSATPTLYYLSRRKISTVEAPTIKGKWFFEKIKSLPEAIENKEYAIEFEKKIRKKSYIELLENGSGTTFYAEKNKSVQWKISIDGKYLIFWENGKKVPTVYRIIKKSNKLEMELFDDYWFELKKSK